MANDMNERIPEMITLTEDIDGNPFVPGQQPQAVRELWEAGKSHVEDKAAHAKLTKRLKEAKEDLKALYRKHPSFFVPADDDPNVLIYSIGGLVIEVDREETFEIKTRKDAPPPISNAAQETEKTVKALKKNKGEQSPADIY